MTRRALMIALAMLSLLGFSASGQTETAAGNVECPPALVCISREAAIKALQDSDRVKALEAEMVVKDQAIADLKKLLDDIRLELARTSGQLTGEQQTNVQNRAIIDLLLKSAKKKCMPFSICF